MSKDTMDKERKLTKEELLRKKKLEALTEKLTAEGYTRKDLTVGVLEANLKGPLLAIPFLVCEIAIFRIVYRNMIYLGLGGTLWIWLVILLAIIVLHELIHGVTWGIFAENHMKDIAFGVIWKALTPYCTCSSPLKRSEYIIGAAMPTLILGIGLFIISLITGNYPLYLVSLFMTLSGCGDMLIIYTLCKYKSNSQDILIYDHPYECGSIIFER